MLGSEASNISPGSSHPKIHPPDKSCASVHRKLVTKTLITHPKSSDRDCKAGASVIEIEGRKLKKSLIKEITTPLLILSCFTGLFPPLSPTY